MTDRSLPQRLPYFYSVSWNMQSVSHLTNGRDGVKICGGVIWETRYDAPSVPAAMRVQLYRDMLNNSDSRKGREIRARLAELKGKNLFCICPAGQPCHGDVLIELANPELFKAEAVG